ncbi:VPS4-associated protein 1 [Mycena pura]|uniref:VPS4-associated protein 1 n=1 Tax=Mycena pura TaxID=153505 RepID=A0AAD6YTG3_9AGAR|nr:VPS4-associated protein 1 [Mycena pura]
MSFTNLYYKRTAGTAKPCYVCYKPTTTVLATINTVDFFYTCPTHLADAGFASPFQDPEAAKKPAVSEEDIGKAIKEYEESQKRKKEVEKEKEKEKDKGKDGEGTKDVDEAKAKEDTSSPKLPGSLSPRAISTPTHQRFTLHRDMFAMRLGEHRKRRQAAQVKDLAPRFPGAPRGTL